jgi:hypothetical protein
MCTRRVHLDFAGKDRKHQYLNRSTGSVPIPSC